MSRNINKKFKMVIAVLCFSGMFCAFASASVCDLAYASEIADEEVQSEEQTIDVQKVEISDYEEKLAVGETMTLTATVVPSDATDAEVTFSSSSSSIATVSSTGEVKGISKGNVTIFATAGGVTAKVSLTVYVETKEISLNSNYVVLKPGDTFCIEASAQPSDADQTFSFKSANTEIASVESDGTVVAKTQGNTAIIVSNDDMRELVTVIVGKESSAASVDNTADGQETKTESNSIVYDTMLENSEYQTISSDMLQYYYENKSRVCIKGNGYSIMLYGEEIVNWANELSTDISLQTDGEDTTFILNEGEALCGPLTVCIDELQGKYLYLWNETKQKYELLEADDLMNLQLTVAGKYLITENKIRDINWRILGILLGCLIAVFAGVIIYICKYKKYWFW